MNWEARPATLITLMKERRLTDDELMRELECICRRLHVYDCEQVRQHLHLEGLDGNLTLKEISRVVSRSPFSVPIGVKIVKVGDGQVQQYRRLMEYHFDEDFV